MERLLALGRARPQGARQVPRPRRHKVHVSRGAWHPGASLRDRVVSLVAEDGEEEGLDENCTDPEEARSAEVAAGSVAQSVVRVPHRPGTWRRAVRRYYTWAELLRRVFRVEIFACSNCRGTNNSVDGRARSRSTMSPKRHASRRGALAASGRPCCPSRRSGGTRGGADRSCDRLRRWPAIAAAWQFDASSCCQNLRIQLGLGPNRRMPLAGLELAHAESALPGCGELAAADEAAAAAGGGVPG